MAIDPALGALGPLAPGLAGIDVAAGNGAPLGVNLLDPAQRHRQSDPWQRWNLALLAVALLALAATMAQLLDNRRAAADELEQRIARNAQAARLAATQRQRLSDLVEGQAFLDRTRAARPMAVAVIDELTPPPARYHLPRKAVDRGRSPDPDRPQSGSARADRSPAGLAPVELAGADRCAAARSGQRPRSLHPHRRACRRRAGTHGAR
jgi:hypothetical protein